MTLPKKFFGASRLLLRPLVGRLTPAQVITLMKSKIAIFTHFCQFSENPLLIKLK